MTRTAAQISFRSALCIVVVAPLALAFLFATAGIARASAHEDILVSVVAIFKIPETERIFRIVNLAKADIPPSPNGEIVGILNETKNVQSRRAAIDNPEIIIVDELPLCPLGCFRERNRTGAPGSYGTGSVLAIGRQINGSFWKAITNIGAARNGSDESRGSTAVLDPQDESKFLVRGKTVLPKSRDTNGNERSLTFNERPRLDSPHDSQYSREDTDDPGPMEHRVLHRLYGWSLFCLGLIGCWVGVWAVVFWDRLGNWRWVVSLCGWVLFTLGIVQGIPLMTAW